MRSLFLCIALFAPLLACTEKSKEPLPQTEKSKVPPKQKKPAHPAVSAANEILSAITQGNAEKLHARLNETNQKKLSLKKLKQYLSEMKEEVGGVTEIEELRKAPKFAGKGSVIGKIRTKDSEVYTVVLTFEKGRYWFEDINSPSVNQYEKLEKLWP